MAMMLMIMLRGIFNMFRKKRLFLKYRGTAYLNSISRRLDGCSVERVSGVIVYLCGGKL